MNTVFHVSTTEQLSYVDAKVENLLADESVVVEEVAVVLDAPGPIEAAAGRLSGVPEAILEAGGAVLVCSNALGGADTSGLPAGLERVPSGVGALTRLQDRGYAYIWP